MLKSQILKIPTKWKDVILDYIASDEDYWNVVESKYAGDLELYEGHSKILPPLENIFKCFHYFEPEDTKVVIIGQDPYHRDGQATGLSFAVNEHTKKPPSLKNIEKELLKDYNKTIEDTSLEKWAKQNILMLNISLTVLERHPGSWIGLWRPLTYHVLHYVSEMPNKVVFVAWGGFAWDVLANIQPRHDDNHVIVTSHPSPLGYSKTMQGHHSFKDSQIFKKIDSFLETKIQW